MIETERLRIYAASQEQMEAFIAAQSIDVLKAAYMEMLEDCLSHILENSALKVSLKRELQK